MVELKPSQRNAQKGEEHPFSSNAGAAKKIIEKSHPRPQPPLVDTGSREVEMKEIDNDDDVSRAKLRTSAKLHAQMKWLPRDVDLEIRRDYSIVVR